MANKKTARKNVTVDTQTGLEYFRLMLLLRRFEEKNSNTLSETVN